MAYGVAASFRKFPVHCSPHKSHFHDKIKPKREEFDKCKIRLAVQGQHMRLKGEYSVGDYDDAFSACRKRIPHDTQLGHTTKYVH